MGKNNTIKVELLDENKEINYDANLAYNVKWAREHIAMPKMSQEKLAEKVGISVDTVKNIESGKGAKFFVVCKIADVFGVSVDWLSTDHSVDRIDDSEVVSKQSKMMYDFAVGVELLMNEIEKMNSLTNLNMTLVEEQKKVLKRFKEY